MYKGCCYQGVNCELHCAHGCAANWVAARCSLGNLLRDLKGWRHNKALKTKQDQSYCVWYPQSFESKGKWILKDEMPAVNLKWHLRGDLQRSGYAAGAWRHWAASRKALFVWMCTHLHALETLMSGTCWPLLTTSDAHSVAGRVRLMEGSCECWMYTSVVHAWRFPEIPTNFE